MWFLQLCAGVQKRMIFLQLCGRVKNMTLWDNVYGHEMRLLCWEIIILCKTVLAITSLISKWTINKTKNNNCYVKLSKRGASKTLYDYYCKWAVEATVFPSLSPLSEKSECHSVLCLRIVTRKGSLSWGPLVNPCML